MTGFRPMDVLQLVERFPTQEACVKYLERVRWGRWAVCPYCDSLHTVPRRGELRHRCYDCGTSFSVTVGTIFHHTRMPLQKWFLAIHLMLGARKGLSALQLARTLGVDKDTAWRISMKIREAMSKRETGRILSGIIEMDETYVGGKPRKGAPRPGSGYTNKTPVLGAVERGGNAIAKVFDTRSQINGFTLTKFVRTRINLESSRLMTDEYGGYRRMSSLLQHDVLPHSKQYVDGEVHTNTIESFWAIVKRSVMGQFHQVGRKYLQTYMNEICYRYNLRHTEPEESFNLTVHFGLRTRPERWLGFQS